jgi:hypothetical protein
MRTFFRWTAGLALFAVALLMAAGWLLAWAWPEVSQWTGGAVWVDGEPLEWAGWAAFGSVMGLVGVLVALLVVMLVLVVVPLALLLGLGVPLLICGGALALTLAPFVIAALLIIWAVKAACRPRADLPSRA